MLSSAIDTVNSSIESLKFVITSAVVLMILISLIRMLFLPKIKGWYGELKVSAALRSLNSQAYRTFNDLYLPRPDGEGTTQVDHVVVSRFGVFVIETKNYSGWIFGNAKQGKWTQTIYRKKSSFQNPLHQNDLHIRALAQFLSLEEASFHSIIIFVGDCTFKTDLPSNVLRKGLAKYIRAHQTPVLEPEWEAYCADALAHLKNNTDRKVASREHLSSLLERRNSTGRSISRPLQVRTLPSESDLSPEDQAVTCPRCGSPMVKRTAKQGAKVGNQFWGCSTFPRCRGTVPLN